jgi:hypothetical protein
MGRVGRSWARQPVDVSIVVGSVQLSRDGNMMIHRLQAGGRPVRPDPDSPGQPEREDVTRMVPS